MNTPLTDSIVSSQSIKGATTPDPDAFMTKCLDEMTKHAGEMEETVQKLEGVLASCADIEIELKDERRANKRLERQNGILRGYLEENKAEISVLRGMIQDLNERNADLKGRVVESNRRASLKGEGGGL